MGIRVMSGVVQVDAYSLTGGQVRIDLDSHDVSGDGQGLLSTGVGKTGSFIGRICFTVAATDVHDSKLDQTSGPERTERSRWSVDGLLTDLDGRPDPDDSKYLVVRWGTGHTDRRGRGSNVEIRTLSYMIIGSTTKNES